MTGIKAVIFDLDDTLFDCSDLSSVNSRRRAAKVIADSGFPLREEEIVQIMKSIQEGSPRVDVFEELLNIFSGYKDSIDAGREEYNSDVVENIHVFDGVKDTLAKLKKNHKLILITTGVYSRQEKKIKLLGIENYFDLIIINDTEKGLTKDECFEDVLNKYNYKPEEVMSVGDRIQSEIKTANRLGMISVRMLRGRFKTLKPKSDLEVPDYEIEKIDQILDIVKGNKKFNVVAIGGGTGLPKILEGMKKYTDNITAIVTVMDSGRSSGEIRKNLNILPPGDIRNCLVALSNSSDSLRELFQYRFDDGKFEGMSFGNLFIAALVKIKGSFEDGLKEASKILKLKGRVLPPTLKNTHICAELEDGSIVEEERNIIKTGKSPIKKLFLKDKNVAAFIDAKDAIRNADIIILGPGCLFTSILPNLLIKGIPEAIRLSPGKKIYVCNIATQPGQTDNYKASDHVKRLLEYLGEDTLDYVILNNKMPDGRIKENYEKAGSFMVVNDIKDGDFGTRVVQDDIIEIREREDLWVKQDWLRHDPDKISSIITDIASED